MFEIRTANAEDKASIRRIYISVVGSQHGADETLWDQLMRAGGLLVAQTEDRIIGFGGIDVSAPEQLKWLYLLPEHQGKGVGSQLLQRLERIGWESGIEFVTVTLGTWCGKVLPQTWLQSRRRG